MLQSCDNKIDIYPFFITLLNLSNLQQHKMSSFLITKTTFKHILKKAAFSSYESTSNIKQG